MRCKRFTTNLALASLAAMSLPAQVRAQAQAPVEASAPASVRLSPPPTAPARWFSFQDNSIGYRFGTEFKEPAIRDPSNPNGTPITKNIVTLSHVDAWRYGSNFLNLDILKSDRADPANKTSTGAVELYFIYRGQLSPDEVFKTKLFPYGPIRDITFEAGFDRNTKNTKFGSQKWLAVAGPNIHFNVPGFLNVGLHYAQEWNHNGIVGKYIQFDPTFEVEAVYSFPLDFIGAPLRLEGFANLITPKGRDAFGNQTQLELLSQTRLTLDLGQAVFQKPKFLDFSLGFQYWYNKFGNDHTRVKGSIETAPFFATRVHF